MSSQAEYLARGRGVIPHLGDAPDAPFPAIETALDSPDGLLAWGGDLAPERLIQAYRNGIFPWFSEGEPILWWCPSKRCVLPTGRVHVSRRLRRLLRQARYSVTADRAFDAVVEGCGRARAETWITPDMRDAYGAMHRQGLAHSVEVWSGDELAGGLYGLATGRMFFGESMFSSGRDASKVALVTLCQVLATWGFPWLDCQVSNPHLRRMGAVTVPRALFVGEVQRLAGLAETRGLWTRRFAAALAPPPSA